MRIAQITSETRILYVCVRLCVHVSVCACVCVRVCRVTHPLLRLIRLDCFEDVFCRISLTRYSRASLVTMGVSSMHRDSVTHSTI